MKNAALVFNFEFKSILRKKSYMITTIVLCLLVIAAVVIPTFLSGSKAPSKESLKIDPTDGSLIETNEFSEKDVEAILSQSGYFLGTEDLAEFPLLMHMKQQFKSEDELKTALESSEIKYGVSFQSTDSFIFMVKGEKNPIASELIKQTLLQYNRSKFFAEKSIDPELIPEIYSLQVSVGEVDVSQKGMGNFAIAVVYTFLMYMMIIMYGTTVSTSVAREKDNRTMEMLIANTKSDYLIIGKTLAAGLAGLLQILILIATLLISLKVAGKSVLEMLGGYIDINTTTLITTIFFAITGYLAYLLIYAALGALVSKVEDVNYAVTPITLLIVAAYFVTFTGMQNPHGVLFKVASYFPLASTFVMPVRTSLLNIPTVEILISAAIMLISIVLFSILAIRIYRLGSLNYGNRMKFGKTLKMIFKGEDK